MSDGLWEIIEDERGERFDFATNRWVTTTTAVGGERVRIFRGATYGVISPWGIAVTRGDLETDGPFFEVDRDNLIAVPASPAAVRDTEGK